MMDFVRCQRADGSYYGTRGRCQKGREVGAKQIDKQTKKALKQLLGPDKGDLKNGISVTPTDAKTQQKLHDLGGFPRPLAEAIGKNLTVVARRTHRPWKDLGIPLKALTPYREFSPMKSWLEEDTYDLDMAVNPTLVKANNLLKPAYQKYNKEFFDNKLPDIDLFVAPSLRRARGLAFPPQRDGTPMRIAMSWPHLKRATEEEIHGILLHEMVHIDMFRQRKWSVGHGQEFVNALNSIDKKWKRYSSDVYPDQLINTYPVSRKREMKVVKERDFPNIQDSYTFRFLAEDDANYRIIG